MTQFQFGKRALFAASVVGLALGIGGGLLLGWMVWPVQVTNVDLPDLRDSAQEDYIVLVAKTYAHDSDLDNARERLALLKKSKVEDQVAALAQKYPPDNPNYEYLTKLALALGSTQVKVAQVVATTNPTLVPTNTLVLPPNFSASEPAATSSPTTTTTLTRTLTPARPATRTPTRPPRATATLKPAPVAGTDWIPSYPAEWPGGVQFQATSAAPGQKYWHLARAQYCDDRDERNNCPNLPGGSTGTNTYVKTIDAGGNRTNAPLLFDGTTASEEEKSPTDMCDCNYTFIPDGRAISIGGSPSDKISGLALYSVRLGIRQAHVRYYLTFQLVTR